VLYLSRIAANKQFLGTLTLDRVVNRVPGIQVPKNYLISGKVSAKWTTAVHC